MRLEQRIGRVDRIGQKHPVRAVNLLLEGSVEQRVREVLEEKLQTILHEFGVDKAADVLDSVDAGKALHDLHVAALLDPAGTQTKADEVVRSLGDQVRITEEISNFFEETEPSPSAEIAGILQHPLPYWVERMTVSYLRSHGGKATCAEGVWDLVWPDGERWSGVVFSGKRAAENPARRLVTLEDERVRALAKRLAPFVPDQPVPVISLANLPPDVNGVWSLWRVSLVGPSASKSRMMPLFLADDGRVFLPTARYVWERLTAEDPTTVGWMEPDAAREAVWRMREVAERHGKAVYDELVRQHRRSLAARREKGAYAFAARRRAIERIGLPQVRNHRLRRLAQEEEEFETELDRESQTMPELVPLMFLRVEGSAHG
ncbi:hypothetical protein [Deferrisoma palaeochoriense]